MRTISLILLFISIRFLVFGQDATEIVKKANTLKRGNSNYVEMTMKIVRPKWSRTVSFKSCNLGNDYGITLVTAPTKDAGQTFLKIKTEMWTWNPTINKTIQMGNSMLSQGWMSSDFSNDELLNEQSIVVNYTHKILGNETVSERDCYKIECKANTDAEVVWGKQIRWISKTGNILLKTEYYDEDMYLVKTETASNIKTMDGKEIPTQFEIVTEEEPDNKTIITIENIIYDVKVDATFFTKENMKKGLTIDFPKD